MNRYLLLSILIINISCNKEKDSNIKNKEFNKEVLNCINKNSKIYTYNLFNIYDEYIKMEKVLLKNEVLKNRSKKEYKKLFVELSMSEKNDEKYNKLYGKIKDKLKYSNMLVDPGIFQAPFMCNKINLEKYNLKTSKDFISYHLVLESIINGMAPDDHTLALKLINSTPNKGMNEIIFRAPLLAVFFGILLEIVE